MCDLLSVTSESIGYYGKKSYGEDSIYADCTNELSIKAWGCRTKKLVRSPIFMLKTQKPGFEKPGFCCKIYLCH